ncbi:MAG: ferritin [Bacteriovoracaceae bacterium]|nr:ferritin [Bacteriovoracaceae bacterium]
MLSTDVEKALNEQINFELYSSYIYLSMSAYFESIDLPGFAHWMKIQNQEELVHVHKLFDYINEREGRVTLTAIEAPQLEWESALDAFQDAYEHEQKVTARVNKIVDLSIVKSDHATNSFLQWFVQEQVEEESSVKKVVQDLKMVGKDGHGLFMLNRELAQRVFVPPADSNA